MAYDEARQEHLNEKYRHDPRDNNKEEPLSDDEAAVELLQIATRNINRGFHYSARLGIKEAQTLLEKIEKKRSENE